MQIPKSFTLFGQNIKVLLKDIDLDESRYGYWNDVTNEIVIYKQVRVDGETINLSTEQINHTFFHELRHAMQYFSVGSCNEQDAQTFASLMMEFIKSSHIRIDPNIVQESIKEEFYNE